METTFPFASFERQKHLTRTVKITEPFGIFRILKMIPHIIVQPLKPLQASNISSQLIPLYHCYGTLNMDPPQFLVPLEFLSRISISVQKIENSAVFFVPAVFDDA